MTKTRKVLLFIFSLFSIGGLVQGLFLGVVSSKSGVAEAVLFSFLIWAGSSAPLLAQIAFCIIFKIEENKDG